MLVFLMTMCLFTKLSEGAVATTVTKQFTASFGPGLVERVSITSAIGPVVFLVDHTAVQVVYEFELEADDQAALDALKSFIDGVTGAQTATAIDVDLGVATQGNVSSSSEYQVTAPEGTSFSGGPHASGALCRVSVPPQVTTVCYNGYCGAPVFKPVPPEDPGKSMYQLRALDAELVYDGNQGLLWRRDILPAPYAFTSNDTATIEEIQGACAALGEGFRVPTKDEHFSLMNHRKGGSKAYSSSAAIDTALFPKNGLPFNTYAWWTSTREWVQPHDKRFFALYAWAGEISYNGDVRVNSAEVRVRCVRTVLNKERPSTRWVEQEAGRWLDTHTLLEWTHGVSAEKWDVDNIPKAIDYCFGLDVGSRRDWQLPDLKQLQSFATNDDGVIQPYWEVPTFGKPNQSGNRCCGCFWAYSLWEGSKQWPFTGTGDATGGPVFWYWSSNEGVVYLGDKNYGITCYARCVRPFDAGRTIPYPDGDTRSTSLATHPFVGEEVVSSGVVDLVRSGDIELFVEANKQQEIGIIFKLPIFPSATIVSAHLDLTSINNHSASPSVTALLSLQYTSNAKMMDRLVNKDISSTRAYLAPEVSWSITEEWVDGSHYSSPDLSAHLQTLVQLPLWKVNSAVLVRLRADPSSLGKRVAWGGKCGPVCRPALHVVWRGGHSESPTPAPSPTSPTSAPASSSTHSSNISAASILLLSIVSIALLSL